MIQCPACGQTVKSERDEVLTNLLAWSFTSAVVWSTMLSVAEWRLAWWSERTSLTFVLAVPLVGAAWFWGKFLLSFFRRAAAVPETTSLARAAAILAAGDAASRRVPESERPPKPAPKISDPGGQALALLRRGENCDWYSIKHLNEMHEAFDCLEIYWRTNVEHPEKNVHGYGRGPFELKAGFRVRWHVARALHSHVEAVGIDLLTTILEAREQADRLVERAQQVDAMGYKHPALEAWKGRGPERKYSFHGLDLEKWNVRLDYPGGLSWAKHEELEQAVADALAKGPQ